MDIFETLDLVAHWAIENEEDGAGFMGCFKTLDKELGVGWRMIAQLIDDPGGPTDIYDINSLRIVKIVHERISEIYFDLLMNEDEPRKTFERIGHPDLIDPDGMLEYTTSQQLPPFLLAGYGLPDGWGTKILRVLPHAKNSSLPLEELLPRLAHKAKCLCVRIRPDSFLTKERRHLKIFGERERIFGRNFSLEEVCKSQLPMESKHYKADRYGTWKYTTQFLWEEKGNEIQFSCEELPVNNIGQQRFHKNGREYLITRFAHGIFDRRSRQFKHFDGHIHIYGKEQFDQRSAKELSAHFNEYRKVKIFACDCTASTGYCMNPDLIFDLLCGFFRWNSLIPEYLGKVSEPIL